MDCSKIVATDETDVNKEEDKLSGMKLLERSKRLLCDVDLGPTSGAVREGRQNDVAIQIPEGTIDCFSSH
jgi:hypothetical protein